jgi:hypothetical protein
LIGRRKTVFAGVFFGLLGFTIVLWGVFPRWMGYVMFVSGPCYIINSCLYLFWPGYSGTITALLLLPALISHFWLVGWLLVNTPHPSKNRDLSLGFFTKDGEVTEEESTEPQK